MLKDHPRAVNIFITADIEDRIKRVSEIYRLTSQDKALAYIKKMDKKDPVIMIIIPIRNGVRPNPIIYV